MYNFDALMSRLKYIPRWSLMRQNRAENVARHSFETALLSHTLAMLANRVFGKNVDGEKLVLAALYHDAGEILTGDMPTPVKYGSERLKNAYKEMESRAVESLVETAHPLFRGELSEAMSGSGLTEYEKKLLKAADKLSALIKCIEEKGAGNKEFDSAYKSTKKAIEDMRLEEADYFMANMLGGYEKCLDELRQIREESFGNR